MTRARGLGLPNFTGFRFFCASAISMGRSMSVALRRNVNRYDVNQTSSPSFCCCQRDVLTGGMTSMPSGSRPASRRNSSKFSGSLSYPGVVATPSVPSNSTPGRKFLGACTFGAGLRFSSISR